MKVVVFAIFLGTIMLAAAGGGGGRCCQSGRAKNCSPCSNGFSHRGRNGHSRVTIQSANQNTVSNFGNNNGIFPFNAVPTTNPAPTTNGFYPFNAVPTTNPAPTTNGFYPFNAVPTPNPAPTTNGFYPFNAVPTANPAPTSNGFYPFNAVPTTNPAPTTNGFYPFNAVPNPAPTTNGFYPFNAVPTTTPAPTTNGFYPFNAVPTTTPANPRPIQSFSNSTLISNDFKRMSFADFRKRWDCTVQTLQYAVIEGVIQDVGNGNTCIVQTGTGTVTVELVQCSRRRFRKGFNRFNKGDRVKCDGVNKDSQFVAREIQCLN